MKRMILALVVLLAASPSWAGFININAAAMIPDSQSPAARGTCNSSTTPPCDAANHEYLTFANSVEGGNAAWVRATIPQDVANRSFGGDQEIGFRCGFSAWRDGTTSGDVTFAFYARAFYDIWDATPASAGEFATATATFPVTDEVGATVRPTGSFVNIDYADAGTDCTAALCQGMDLQIKIVRSASDPYNGSVNLTNIVCEF